jgi:hypothetical protein
MSRHVDRAHSTFVASSSARSHEPAMFSTHFASRLPTGEWSSGRFPIAPPSGKSRIAENGEAMRAACSRYFAIIAGSSPGRYSDFQ